MKVGREKELLKTRKGLNFNSEHRRNMRGESGIYQVSNYRTIALISYTSKVMLKILQVRFQQYMNREFPHVQAGLEKAKEPEIKLPTSVGSQKKQENSRKTSTSVSLAATLKLLTLDHNKPGKILKRLHYQTTLPTS